VLVTKDECLVSPPLGRFCY